MRTQTAICSELLSCSSVVTLASCRTSKNIWLTGVGLYTVSVTNLDGTRKWMVKWQQTGKPDIR